jgi:hypothetical protein
MSTQTGRHFRDSFQPTLAVLSELIGQQRPIFAMPSWFITADNAGATAPSSPTPATRRCTAP